MKLLVEFSHPAQVHKFKHVLKSLMDKEYQVLILARKKDVMIELLEYFNLPYICISRAGMNRMSMAFELILREVRTLWQALRFKPDCMLSAHSVAITHIGWLLGIPRVVHDDTEHASLQQRLYMPFATHIVTSSAYSKNWGNRQVRINSIEPLAYLHPDHFSPDPTVLLRYGLDMEIPYAVVRFIAWQAAHDIGYKVDSKEERGNLIDKVLDAGAEKVVLSCEGFDYRINQQRVIKVCPEDFHHVLAFSRLCISEGGSVANESAVLGIPTVLVNPQQAGLFNELERYGLLVHALTMDEAIDKGLKLWNDSFAIERCKQARKRILNEKVNMAKALTEFLINFLENKC